MVGAPHVPPSQWPTTIGSIAIIFGAIGALMSLWGLASSTIMSAMTTPGMPAGFAIPAEMTTFNLVDSLLGLAFAAMLIVGGIATLRRRRNGPRVLRTYAIIRLVLVVPLSVTQGYLSSRMMEKVVAAMERTESATQPAQDTDADAAPAPAKNAGPPPAMMKQIMTFSAVGGTVCAGLLSAVWPTVLLVLLANGRRKDEIAGWP